MHRIVTATAVSIAVVFIALGAMAALPPSIAGEIHTVVASFEAETTRSHAVAGLRKGPSEGAAIRERARETSARHMAEAVSDGIARRPDLAGEIVAEAVAALPHARSLVVGTAVAAHPDAASAIRAAALRVPPERTAASPDRPPPGPMPAAAAPDIAQQARPATQAPRPPPGRLGPTVEEGPLDIRPVPAPVQRVPAPEQPVRKLQEPAPGDIAPVRPPAARAPPPAGAVPEFAEPALPLIDPVPDPGSGGAQRDPLPAPGGEGFAAPIPDPVQDPLEDVNRVIFAFNDALDTYIIRPLAWGYAYVMPDVAERAVRRAFGNLKEPIVFANDVIQGEFTDASVTAGRFVVNTTIGVVGLFDVAETFGMPGHPADFGQTMHSYGVDPGPYLVIPVLGPTTTRDGVGDLADMAFDPLTYVADTETRLAVTAGDGLTLRASLIEPLDEMKKSALDYYAAIRSAYYQDRAKTLRRGRPASARDIDAEFGRLE